MTGEQIAVLIQLKVAFAKAAELGLSFDVEVADCDASCSAMSHSIAFSRIIAEDGYDQIDILNGAVAGVAKQQLAPVMNKWMKKHFKEEEE
jgi:cupin superfamily acireductone dioxygenase involved in methionine salvage